MKKKGYLFASISAISYGLIPFFVIPVKAAGFSLDKTLFFRFLISALFILAFLVFKKVQLKIAKSELLIMFILGLFYALSSEFLFLAYDYLMPGIASTILFVYPVFVALIMTFVFKEKLHLFTIFSLSLTIIGVIALSKKESSMEINLIGLGIALLGALFYALYIVLVNKAKISFSGMKTTFYSLLFTALYYFIKLLFKDESFALSSGDLFNIILFSIVTTVISISTLIYAIKYIGSTPTSIMGALEPVVAVGVSVLFFQEEFTLSLFIGVVLILIGVILNILSERKTPETQEI